MSRRTAASALALAGVLVLTAGSAQAAPGALDPTFGSGGKVTTSFGSTYDFGNALAIQPDGKIIAGGQSSNGLNYDFVLSRYNADGSLDSAFDSDGKVMTPFGAYNEGVDALVIQPDGKIVAAGYTYNGTNSDFALARYNADGSLDSAFGSGGKVTTNIASRDEYISAMALQPDGKIVVAGFSEGATTSDDFAVARYNADGTLDASFGTGGYVLTVFDADYDDAYALLLQPDGKIVAAGYTYNGANTDFALARYNADGSLDSSFGAGGKVTTDIASRNNYLFAAALQPDGKIVVCGYSDGATTSDDFAVARYNVNGTLDTSFGTGGYVLTVFNVHYDDAYSLLLQPDGKIVAVGSSGNATGTQYFFALARYTSGGALDPTFGSGGKVETAIGTRDDDAFGAVLQPDGKIVAGGYTKTPSAPFHTLFALARYNTDGSLDSTFGSGGKVTTAVGTYDGINELALQPDGRIVGAGYSEQGTYLDVALARYNADGSLDSSFGAGGKVTNGTGAGDWVARGVALQADGKIVAGGLAFQSTTDSDFFVERLLGQTLTVTKTGSGKGTVTSSPAGLDCGSTCSAPFAAVSVTLIATPAKGSYLAGWSGDCSGKGKCTLTMSADHAATARFLPQCIVPKVKGKKLAAAKRAIKKANCSVGRVTKAFSAKVKKGRVISQKPAPGKKLPYHAKVKLKVSKGPRS